MAARKIDLNVQKVYHELGHSVDAGVEILAKNVNGKTFLITVNSDKNPVRVSLLGLKNFDHAKVLTENRTITIKDGELVENYKPFDVHVYEMEN